MKTDSAFKSRYLPFVNHADQLRVGLFLTSMDQPAWVAKILSRLKFSSFAEISLILLSDPSLKTLETPPQYPENSTLWNVVAKIDKLRHIHNVGSNQKRNIQNIVQSVPVVKISSNAQVLEENISTEVIQKIQESNLDLILYFGPLPIPSTLLKTTHFGIWPYFNRFTHWQIPSTALEYLLKLYEYGLAVFKDDPYFSTFPSETLNHYEKITNKVAWSFAWRAIKQYFLDNIFEHTHVDRFEIAYQLNHTPDLEDLKFKPEYRLIPPIYKIYGDPFPIEADGKFYIFFEEMFAFDPELSGIISVTEIHPQTGKAGKIKQVLKRKYHLSYPMIFKWANDFYMIPETGQNKNIELFRASSFPYKWEFIKVLVPDVCARDTTLFEKDGKFWLFACMSEKNPEIEGFISDQLFYSLHLYSADSPLGPWIKHPQNPVKMDSYNTRSAGHIFYWNNQLVRPTQDCSPRYGYAVIFNRIDVLNGDAYHETEIGKMLPPHTPGMLGVHTFNHCNGLTVIDINRFRSLIG